MEGICDLHGDCYMIQLVALSDLHKNGDRSEKLLSPFFHTYSLSIYRQSRRAGSSTGKII